MESLIPPIRKHTYAPDVEPSDLIHDEAVFQALTGIDWTTIDFQPLGGEKEDEPTQEDPQPSHQPEAESSSGTRFNLFLLLSLKNNHSFGQSECLVIG